MGTSKNSKWWFWLRRKLNPREQEELKSRIRRRLLTMDKRRCIPKPRVRYKLKSSFKWRDGGVIRIWY